MDNEFFRQKSSDFIPTGQEQEAVDANPSEASVRVGAPVWEKFVTNTVATKHNRAAVAAENDQIRQANMENARSRASQEIWKGGDGKLLRKVGRQSEMLDAA